MLGLGVVLDSDTAGAGTDNGGVDEDGGWVSNQVNVISSESEQLAWPCPGRDKAIGNFM